MPSNSPRPGDRGAGGWLTGRRKLQSSADGLNLVKRFSLLQRRDLHGNVPDRRGFARSAQDFTARQLTGEAVEGLILDTPADNADAFDGLAGDRLKLPDDLGVASRQAAEDDGGKFLGPGLFLKPLLSNSSIDAGNHVAGRKEGFLIGIKRRSDSRGLRTLLSQVGSGQLEPLRLPLAQALLEQPQPDDIAQESDTSCRA